MKLIGYNRIAILDCEATDRFYNSSAPVEIACVIVDAEGNEIDRFYERIHSTHKMSYGASLVTGIYDKDLVGCRDEVYVLTDFCEWLAMNNVDCMMTYNGDVFDRPMLNARCEIMKIAFPYFKVDQFPGIDVCKDVKLAKKWDMWGLKSALGRKWNLKDTCGILGIKNEGAHNAFNDVIMTKELFWKIDPSLNPGHWEK